MYDFKKLKQLLKEQGVDTDSNNNSSFKPKFDIKGEIENKKSTPYNKIDLKDNTTFKSSLKKIEERIKPSKIQKEIDRKLDEGEITIDFNDLSNKDLRDKVIPGKKGFYYLDQGTLYQIIFYIKDGYIHRDSRGKIIRYNKRFNIPDSFETAFKNKDFDSQDFISVIHRYHFLKCEHFEENKKRMQVSSRLDGTFYYEFTDNGKKHTRENQKLRVCGGCLKKLGQITGKYYPPLDFVPKDFFDKNKIKRSNCSIPSQYSEDWREISKKYRQSVNWQCEGCNKNLVNSKKYLETHHMDRNKKNNNSSNLVALCIGCHAEQDNHEHLKEKSDYKEYMRLINTNQI